MAYIGNQTSNSYSSMDKQSITGDGGTGYTLTHAVANAQEIEVFVNNVRQEPGVAYTVSGTTLTMTGNVASTDDFYVVYQGKALQTVTPPDLSVTTAKIVDANVTTAKIADDAVTTAKLADSAVTTAKLPAGTILQVVSDSDTTATAMTSSYADYLSVNITPESTSSTILVMATVATYHVSAGSVGAMKLVRDSSNLNYEVGDYYHQNGGGVPGNLNITMVDSPATTSQVNYKIQVKEEAGSVETNKDYNGTTNGISSLVVMEIAG